MLIALVVATVMLVALSGAVFADKNNTSGNFLCPVVGNANAAAHNGQGWFDVAAGKSFLPGKNQAGMHANNHARNTEGPGTSPGPGKGNSDWSPIWPGD